MSNRAKLWNWFVNNGDDSLTIFDACVKFDLTEPQVRQAMRNLVSSDRVRRTGKPGIYRLNMPERRKHADRN